MFQSEVEIINRVRSLLNLRISVAKDTGAQAVKLNPGGGDGRSKRNHANKEARWKKLFLQYDSDRSGVICFRELRTMVRTSLRISEANCPDRDLLLMFQTIDLNKSGYIEFNEFVGFVHQKKTETEPLPKSLGRALKLALLRNRIRSEDELITLFRKSDIDSDHGLSMNEVRRLLRETMRLSQHEISEHNIKRLMEKLDLNCSGQIEYEEFARFVTSYLEEECTSKFDLGQARLLGSRGYAHPSERPEPKVVDVKSTLSLPSLRLGTPLESAEVASPSFLCALPSSASLPRTAWGAATASPSASPVAAAAQRQPASEQAGTTGGSFRDADFSGAGAALRGVSGSKSSGGLPYVGRPRYAYLNMKGAESLNRVEQRLFDAGYDVRGAFYKVAEDAEPTTFSSASSSRGFTASFANGSALSPESSALSFAGSPKKLRNGGRCTVLLRQVASELL